MTRNYGFPQNPGDSGQDPGRGSAGGMGGGFPGPGRRVEQVRVYHLPSGRTRELREVIETVRDEFNNFFTTSRAEAKPPLDCCVPEDVADIAECSNPECRAVVCRSRHSFTCEACGKVHCTACGVADEYGYFRICKKCWRRMTTPRLVRWLKNLFWGEE